MRKTMIAMLLLAFTGCSSPYFNPQTSKAISEQKQIEILQGQDSLLREQNKQLKRIADALDKLSNK